MVMMPILLMNLLVGLAVGDIEAVRKNAALKRLAMQVCLGWNGSFSGSRPLVAPVLAGHGREVN